MTSLLPLNIIVRVSNLIESQNLNQLSVVVGRQSVSSCTSCLEVEASTST